MTDAERSAAEDSVAWLTGRQVGKTRVPRTIFGLVATGDSLNGWAFRLHSRRMFMIREAAEAYCDEFRASCCDASHFECAEPSTLKITIIEHELH